VFVSYIAVVTVWSVVGIYSVHVSVLLCSLLYHMSSCFWQGRVTKCTFIFCIPAVDIMIKMPVWL